MKLSVARSDAGLSEKIRHWVLQHPVWALGLATFAVLALFFPKPFNIDDPLFLWAARQIQSHPADPYGFEVNWYGTMRPLWSITENPPLACYYLAGAAKVFGWGEIGLHFAFALPALAVILGTYRLARHFCATTIATALMTLATPVFLVSSSTVMCDVMMLAFWVWAIVFWVEGIHRNSVGLLWFATLLAAFATLTKYFGISLVPLLAAHGICSKNRPKFWYLPLLIPLIFLGFYEAGTKSLYGHGLFSMAMDYAGGSKTFAGISPANAGIGLAFTGGCVAMTVFVAPWLWPKRELALLAGFAVLLGGLLMASGVIFSHYDWMTDRSRYLVAAQFIFWIFGGINLLTLASVDLFSRRDANSCLLFLWVLGTILFAAFLNWTVNARSILPLIPAAAFLLARRLEQFNGQSLWTPGLTTTLILTGLFGLFVARADFLLAVAVRDSAWLTCEKYGGEQGRLEFQGHWGFQYYAEESGGRPSDIKNTHSQTNGYLAIPLNNTGMVIPDQTNARLLETFAIRGPRWLTTWSGGAGAGFYAATRGPIPFAFNHVPAEAVTVYEWNN